MLDLVAEVLFGHGYWLALATGCALTISVDLAMTSAGLLAVAFPQCREREG